MHTGGAVLVTDAKHVANASAIGHQSKLGKAWCNLAKAIIPKKLPSDRQKMSRILVNTMNATAKAVQVDFKVTTQTWDHQPTFAISSPRPYVRQIATDDSVYAMLNKGTKPHTIRPRSSKILRFTGPFRPKSRPGYIGSNKGSQGTAEIWAHGVNHPGTVARNWAKTIAAKWRRQFPMTMQRSIDSEY